MPIVHVQFVSPEAASIPEGLAKALAQALAVAFLAPEGHVWVKLEHLASHLYAENSRDEHPSPVFVDVLLADLPPREELATQALAISEAVSTCLGCLPSQVHVLYSPPGRDRVAFGGKLLQ